jgi:hypothetical protein
MSQHMNQQQQQQHMAALEQFMPQQAGLVPPYLGALAGAHMPYMYGMNGLPQVLSGYAMPPGFNNFAQFNGTANLHSPYNMGVLQPPVAAQQPQGSVGIGAGQLQQLQQQDIQHQAQLHQQQPATTAGASVAAMTAAAAGLQAPPPGMPPMAPPGMVSTLVYGPQGCFYMMQPASTVMPQGQQQQPDGTVLMTAQGDGLLTGTAQPLPVEPSPTSHAVQAPALSGTVDTGSAVPTTSIVPPPPAQAPPGTAAVAAAAPAEYGLTGSPLGMVDVKATFPPHVSPKREEASSQDKDTAAGSGDGSSQSTRSDGSTEAAFAGAQHGASPLLQEVNNDVAIC